MNLFNYGDFILHSGEKSNFKIDCDALTDDDIDAVATIFCKRLTFNEPVGIPRGGIRLEQAIKKYQRSVSDYKFTSAILIVDDVYTTGKSMEEKRLELMRKDASKPISGAVIFARAIPPSWIYPLFIMNH